MIIGGLKYYFLCQLVKLCPLIRLRPRGQTGPPPGHLHGMGGSMLFVWDPRGGCPGASRPRCRLAAGPALLSIWAQQAGASGAWCRPCGVSCPCSLLRSTAAQVPWASRGSEGCLARLDFPMFVALAGGRRLNVAASPLPRLMVQSLLVHGTLRGPMSLGLSQCWPSETALDKLAWPATGAAVFTGDSLVSQLAGGRASMLGTLLPGRLCVFADSGWPLRLPWFPLSPPTRPASSKGHGCTSPRSTHVHSSGAWACHAFISHLPSSHGFTNNAPASPWT